MLNRTFVHVPGIGLATEQKLWRYGLYTWEACIQDPGAIPLGTATRTNLLQTLEESTRALEARDAPYFARTLPSSEHWRAVRAFPRVGYLDIETDGTDRVTVIGLYDGSRVRQYVRGDNLEEFPEEVAPFDVLVTFFGAGFDLPVLKRNFRGLRFDMLHVDLCFALRKLGYRGGLKSIERGLGIARSSQTAGLGGWDAVRLWNEYLAGSEESLAVLLAYNAEDIVNLEPLVDVAYKGLMEKLTGTRAPGQTIVIPA